MSGVAGRGCATINGMVESHPEFDVVITQMRSLEALFLSETPENRLSPRICSRSVKPSAPWRKRCPHFTRHRRQKTHWCKRKPARTSAPASTFAPFIAIQGLAQESSLGPPVREHAADDSMDFQAEDIELLLILGF